MSDELRDRLRRLDVSQPAIQGAANAMMRHYDRSPMTAVTEWRNALQTTERGDQETLLSLLYVANEVLQNSRRNRGKAFVEKFAPIMQQSLVYMAQTPELTEKIRRVVKIWGDRRIFHLKDINAWMLELEQYRERGNTRPDAFMSAQFSPLVNHDGESPAAAMTTPSTASNTAGDAMGNAEDNDDDDDDEHHSQSNSAGQHDIDDIFGDDSERQALEIDVTMVAVAALSNESSSPSRSSQKRRRSNASAGSQGKKAKMLSMTNLLEICNQLAENQQKFELAQLALQRIAQNIATVSNDDLSNLIGDELQEAVKQNESDLRTMMTQKRVLHALANERRALGNEATRYLPWLDAALVQDKDDMVFAAALQEKIVQFQPIHVELKKTRDVMREEDKRNTAVEAEQERRRKEAEEAEKFRQAALSRENEEKPGMVWNPSTREYQALNTDESWRD